MKYCSCGREPFEFYKDKNNKDGLDSRCKRCRKDYDTANKLAKQERSKKSEARRKIKKAWKTISASKMKQLQSIAKSTATKWNMPHLEQDLASDLILKASRGMLTDPTKTIIDLLREQSGKKTTAQYNPSANDVNNDACDYSDNGATQQTIEFNHDIKEFIKDKYTSQLPSNRACYYLKYVYGLTAAEICEVFGTFHTKIQSVLQGVEMDLKQYLGVMEKE